MKKTIFTMAGIALSMLFVTANAQEDTSKVVTTTSTTTTWDAKKNPTVDSINAKYKDQLVPARAAMTTEQIFPVLGQYTSTTNTDAPSVTITLDETNKGMVWIDGLPQGKVKAMLRKSPSTYKIPAQKTEDGKDVAEGTLYFDKDANTLNILIGKAYDINDPMTAFATPAIGDEQKPAEEIVKAKAKNGKTKIKTKVPAQPKSWSYTGTKVETATAAMTPAVNQ